MVSERRKGAGLKGMQTARPALMHEGGKQFRKKYQYCLLVQLFMATVPESPRSYLSGHNTSEIVHLTKRSNIIESTVAIKTCLTASELHIERQGFKVNVHVSSSSPKKNPVYPGYGF